MSNTFSAFTKNYLSFDYQPSMGLQTKSWHTTAGIQSILNERSNVFKNKIISKILKSLL
jgi:hypothetical protein